MKKKIEMECCDICENPLYGEEVTSPVSCSLCGKRLCDDCCTVSSCMYYDSEPFCEDCLNIVDEYATSDEHFTHILEKAREKRNERSKLFKSIKEDKYPLEKDINGESFPWHKEEEFVFVKKYNHTECDWCTAYDIKASWASYYPCRRKINPNKDYPYTRCPFFKKDMESY